MFRKALFASMIVLGAAGVAQAQDSGPRLVGGGENAQVVYTAPSNNVVGGAAASISGGGDNLQIAYGSLPTVRTQSNMTAELVGGGENAQVVYHQTVPSGSMLAGRPVRHGG